MAQTRFGAFEPAMTGRDKQDSGCMVAYSSITFSTALASPDDRLLLRQPLRPPVPRSVIRCCKLGKQTEHETRLLPDGKFPDCRSFVRNPKVCPLPFGRCLGEERVHAGFSEGGFPAPR